MHIERQFRSVIVAQSTVQPVGLLFAGQTIAGGYATYSNPIAKVATELGMTFTGGTNHAVAACHGGTLAQVEGAIADSEIERVDAVKQKYEAGLMRFPAVMGVGVGMSDGNASEAVIIVLVHAGMETQDIPGQLDGIRTELIRGSPIEASVKVGCDNPEKSATFFATY